MCLEMGIPKLRVDAVDPPTVVPGGMDYETCFWRTAQMWHRAAEVAGRMGVKFVWEFEPGILFNNPSEVALEATYSAKDGNRPALVFSLKIGQPFVQVTGSKCAGRPS